MKMFQTTVIGIGIMVALLYTGCSSKLFPQIIHLSSDKEIVKYGYIDLKWTPDGGYIVIGNYKYSLKPKQEEVFVMKFNKKGEMEWANSYSGLFSNYLSSKPEITNYIQVTQDNHYIMIVDRVLTTKAGFSERTACILKINSKGMVIWTKILGNEKNKIKITDIQLIGNDGYLLTGSTKYGMIVMKTDTLLNFLWIKKHSYMYDDFYGHGDGISTFLTKNNKIISYGNLNNYFNNWKGHSLSPHPIVPHGFFFEYDWDGNVVSTKEFMLTECDCLNMNIVHFFDNGSILIAGSSCLLKLNAYGEKEWFKRFDFEFARSNIVVTRDGGFTVSVMCPKNILQQQFFTAIVKFTENGIIEWMREGGLKNLGSHFVDYQKDGFIAKGYQPFFSPDSLLEKAQTYIYLLETDNVGTSSCYNATLIDFK